MSELKQFELARAQWLHARAAVADCDTVSISEAASDEKTGAALEVLSEAEWQLIKTPATHLMEIRQRAQIVQEMFDAADDAGEPTDNRHRVMLSVFISEILRYSEPDGTVQP